MELLIKREYPKEKPKQDGELLCMTKFNMIFVYVSENGVIMNYDSENIDGNFVTHFYEPISVEEVAKEQVIKELEKLKMELSISAPKEWLEIIRYRLNQLNSAK